MKETLRKKEERGITLIALIITIVVLLILCGITINAAIGDEGLVKKSNQFADETNSTIEGSMTELNELMQEYNEVINKQQAENGESSHSQVLTNVQPSSNNQVLNDQYENKIVIPAGFTVVLNGTNDVTYEYAKDEHGNSTGIPTVQDGIVVRDNEGNQFVWVPIGTIKNRPGDSRGATTQITLGRYTFDANGNETLKQSASGYSEPQGINNYWGEFTSSPDESVSAVALNLGEWIESAYRNGGYYIARYEASKNGEKAASKQSTGTPLTSEGTPSDGMLWNCIMQPAAAQAARNMYPYSTGAKVYSDLVNSYAWDTALVFIQKYSGYSRGTTKYSTESGVIFSSYIQNTGTNGDEVCNIYDMASNAYEWTTEICTSESPWTYRGSCSLYEQGFTSQRYYYNPSMRSEAFSFRETLCIK